MLLAASVVWLAAGAFVGIESFGIPAFVAWRPFAFVVFLAVNACAAAVVLAEFIAAAWPSLGTRRLPLTRALAALVLLASVAVYLDFASSHAVTAQAF